MGTILNKLGNNIYDGWMIISQSQTKVEEILMWTYIYIYITIHLYLNLVFDADIAGSAASITDTTTIY